MTPHPDFADKALPEQTSLGPFRLEMLAARHVEEDFTAVKASQPALTGMFGPDWPRDLTLEANLIDLCWHEREFAAKRSFAWILRSAQGTYLGCAYLFPDIGQTGKGQAALWVCDRADRQDLLAQILPLYTEFLAGHLPPAYALGIKTNARIGAA